MLQSSSIYIGLEAVQLNKSDLIKAAAAREKVSTEHAEKIIDAFLDAIGLALAGGDPVSIRMFGKFEPRSRKAAILKNPQTGEPMEVSSRVSVGFKSAPALKQRVNGQGY
jgi:DNA-binding protein HU-beta